MDLPEEISIVGNGYEGLFSPFFSHFSLDAKYLRMPNEIYGKLIQNQAAKYFIECIPMFPRLHSLVNFANEFDWLSWLSWLSSLPRYKDDKTGFVIRKSIQNALDCYS